MDLTPMSAEKVFEGDGGEYYVWLSPVLGEAKVGASKFVLKPRGFALPHYSDCAKLGYILQGDGLVGMVVSNASEEVVLKLKKVDVIPVPLGAVSWWFNKAEDSSSEDLVIVFLGETTRAYNPGIFSYFYIAGTKSLLGGFSTDFIGKLFNINKDEVDEVTESQTGWGIVKLLDGKTMPKPDELTTRKLVHELTVSATLTEKEFDFLKQVGLSANLTKLEPNAISSPTYTIDSTFQVIYVASGGGRVQIVGLTGQRVLDEEVTAGDLIVVPRFFMGMKLAGAKGLECFSVITSSRAVLEDLTGKTSVWGALSPEVLRTSLNINHDLECLVRSKIGETSDIA